MCQRFVDKVRIYACGGTGGQGSSKLGCVGGDGGDVYVRAVRDSSLSDLAQRMSRRFLAGVGGSAKRSRVRGVKGDDITISVPPGTVVYDHTEKEMVMIVLACVECDGVCRYVIWYTMVSNKC